MKGITYHLKKHSPTILTVIGAIGVVATAVAAVKATPKAMLLIEQAGYEKGSDENPIEDMEYASLTPVEMVKTAWKPYIPAALIGGATITCIFSANVLNRRQQAAITSAYILLERTYKSYKDKVVELYGKETDRRVREEIVKDDYKEKAEDIPEADSDETLLFYEEHYGQYFHRKMVEVMDAEYRINRKLAQEGEACLNDFFEYLGLDETEVGDALGWSQEGICDFFQPAWIDFEHQLVTMDDGMECYIINILVKPKEGYDCPF